MKNNCLTTTIYTPHGRATFYQPFLQSLVLISLKILRA